MSFPEPEHTGKGFLGMDQTRSRVRSVVTTDVENLCRTLLSKQICSTTEQYMITSRSLDLNQNMSPGGPTGRAERVQGPGEVTGEPYEQSGFTTIRCSKPHVLLEHHETRTRFIEFP